MEMIVAATTGKTGHFGLRAFPQDSQESPRFISCLRDAWSDISLHALGDMRATKIPTANTN